MTDSIKGKSVADATQLIERFQQMVTTQPTDQVRGLGKLDALAGVRQFPVRVKCATLAWHTLRAALDSPDAVVSTE